MSFTGVDWRQHGGTVSGVEILPAVILPIKVGRSYGHLTAYIVWMAGERISMRFCIALMSFIGVDWRQHGGTVSGVETLPAVILTI